ncbi:SpvB/TcaC N-terminal domain-containing protein [Labrenzia sp. OB1]|uniref:SpvB/TcaC N-terminal domain-containing protein n=1 Tax=Labrenzia sp. OB1 TaxID=1561204 RepID=UPI0007B26DBE|nr:SpvB/TcaC N-terminal domain-containing protein [Labrenzia sp. OB1]KZM39701.1 hypothetical protein OA90_27685 [Labrenzia sp. OB1]
MVSYSSFTTRLARVSSAFLFAFVSIFSTIDGGPVASAAVDGEAIAGVMPVYGTSPKQTSHTGAFSEQIDFEIPEQRGLEPKLGLRYMSSDLDSYGMASLLGAGWRLTGTSSIERATARRAVPRFNNQDIWLLDGQELVPCPSSQSSTNVTVPPGCAAGGTHSTWVESYQRIKLDITTNTWTITARNGLKFVYKPVSEFTSYDQSNDVELRITNEYRYLISEKIDTLGKAVHYSYECEELVACRPSKVSYDAGEVDFFYESRPDVVSYATGLSIAKVSNRLSYVLVKSAGVLRRAYVISYAESSATGRSLVTSLQEIGSDAKFEGGRLVSGTRMPAYAFQYVQVDPFPVRVADGLDIEGLYEQLYGNRYLRPPEEFFAFGDFGNDRQLRVIVGIDGTVITGEDPPRVFYTAPNHVYFLKDNHSHRKSINLYWDNSSNPEIKAKFIADFDGDGLDDFISTKRSGQLTGQYYSGSTQQSWSNVSATDIPKDVNGDGLADAVNITYGAVNGSPGPNFVARLSNGADAFEPKSLI